jgi:hypothetical protein
MISKDAVTEKLKKSFATRERIPKNQQLMYPKREWVTGLAVAGCIFLLSAALSAYTFLKNRTTVTPVSDVEEPSTYRENTVAEVLTEIEAREARFNTLTNGATLVPEVEPEGEVDEREASTTPEVVIEQPVATGTLQVE